MFAGMVFSGVGLTREVREASFVLPTFPVFHVPCIVCRRFGFHALHQCQITALFQCDMGLWFGRCGVARSLFPQSETGRTNVTLRAILRQVVPKKLFSFLCLAQQKEFLAPSLAHVVAYNTTLSQSRTRVFTTSHCTFM